MYTIVLIQKMNKMKNYIVILILHKKKILLKNVVIIKKVLLLYQDLDLLKFFKFY